MSISILQLSIQLSICQLFILFPSSEATQDAGVTCHIYMESLSKDIVQGRNMVVDFLKYGNTVYLVPIDSVKN